MLGNGISLIWSHFYLCLLCNWLFAEQFSNCYNSLNFEAKINCNTSKPNVLKCRKTCTGIKFDLMHFNGPQSHILFVDHFETPCRCKKNVCTTHAHNLHIPSNFNVDIRCKSWQCSWWRCPPATCPGRPCSRSVSGGTGRCRGWCSPPAASARSAHTGSPLAHSGRGTLYNCLVFSEHPVFVLSLFSFI